MMAKAKEWAVVIRDRATGTVLCRAIYPKIKQAREAARAAREIRVGQNHENVTVTVEVAE
jgi:hypothetical protein